MADLIDMSKHRKELKPKVSAAAEEWTSKRIFETELKRIEDIPNAYKGVVVVGVNQDGTLSMVYGGEFTLAEMHLAGGLLQSYVLEGFTHGT